METRKYYLSIEKGEFGIGFTYTESVQETESSISYTFKKFNNSYKLYKIEGAD